MKRVFILSLLLFSMLSLHAQVIKINIGPVFSSMELRYPYSGIYDEPYTGFIAGLEVDYLHRQFFKMSSGLNYINAGAKGYITFPDSYIPDKYIYEDITTTLHFINLNTIAYFKYDFKKLFRPYIGIGPELFYLSGYSDILDDSGFDIFFLRRFFRNGTNRFMFGINTVAGISFMTGNLEFGVAYQYSFVITELVRDLINLRESALLFKIGYRFPTNEIPVTDKNGKVLPSVKSRKLIMGIRFIQQFNMPVLRTSLALNLKIRSSNLFLGPHYTYITSDILSEEVERGEAQSTYGLNIGYRQIIYAMNSGLALALQIEISLYEAKYWDHSLASGRYSKKVFIIEKCFSFGLDFPVVKKIDVLTGFGVGSIGGPSVDSEKLIPQFYFGLQYNFS